MSQNNDVVLNRIISKVKENMDAEMFGMSEELINLSIKMVVVNIAKKYESQVAFEDALNRVMGNVVNFVALVVMQLQHFGDGKNEGPFVELFDQLLLQQSQVV